MNSKPPRWALLPAFMLLTALSVRAQSVPVMTASDIHSSLKRLAVTGTVMYIAAHPDDENTALMAYFTQEKKYRTVYLSLTRGEGGQNILGSEKGADLGVVRTQELLAARRIDGAEQLFTRAIDFGFSKTADETMRMWQKDSVVADIVWAIRTVRPDIIITRFSATEGGHGNHTASAILAEEAFERSGDPAAYPGQLLYVRPWTARRLYFNRLRGFDEKITTRQAGETEVNTGIFNPLRGLSYTEMAGISRSLHKTQAMGSQQRRGTRSDYFTLTRGTADAGAAGGADLFAGIHTSWKRFAGGDAVGELLAQADREFDPMHPETVVPTLMLARKKMESLGRENVVTDPVITRKAEELASVVSAALGLRCDILSSAPSELPGRPLRLEAELIVRSTVPVRVTSFRSSYLGIDKRSDDTIYFNTVKRVNLVGSLPVSASESQPYWLRVPEVNNLYRVPTQQYVGLPENPDSLAVTLGLVVAGEPLSITVPVRYRRIDPIDGELYRPVVILPRIDVSLTQKTMLWTEPGSKHITVRVASNDSALRGTLMLKTPAGFHISPVSIAYALSGQADRQSFMFTVTADAGAVSGDITVVATESGSDRLWTDHGGDISYPHIVPQYVTHRAQLKAVRADMKITKRRIGYVMGSGDDMPAELRLCGYDVTPIDDDTLQTGTLSGYDAIVVGARAYNVRPQLRQSTSRLLAYVHAGGTLVVQYQTPGKDVESIGPYPFHVSRERVTDEHAAMRAAPATNSAGGTTLVSSLMRRPNLLTEADFEGWVQERGLYFADTWDAAYETAFLCRDPGEGPTCGSMLAAAYGKGVYVYTGLSFFRQLPAGVPGAFRLFSNLIELSQTR